MSYHYTDNYEREARETVARMIKAQPDPLTELLEEDDEDTRKHNRPHDEHRTKPST
jgi:hypothetical protein